jgi:peptidoglycan/LPS O-acetylase OafA/YrhL
MARKIYFENLDTLRTIACFIVMASHMSVRETFGMVTDNTLFSKVMHLLTSGDIGVSVFFVLSGFLISYLLFKEKEKNQRIKIQHFYLKRVLRIWPIYIGLGIYAFGLYPIIESLQKVNMTYGNSLAYYMAFLSNFDMINLLSDNSKIGLKMVSVTWSVSIEEQFYLIWPLLFILNRKILPYIFFVIILLSIWFRIAHYDEVHTLYFHSCSVVMDLTLGALAAYLSIYNKRFIQLFSLIPKPLNIMIYGTGFSFLIFKNYIYPSIYDDAIMRFVFVLFFAYIIIEQNLNQNSLFKLGNSRLFTKIGKYTYSLYMLHLIIVNFVTYSFRFFDLDYNKNLLYGFLYATVSFIGSGILSYFSYSFFEKPFLKLKEKFTA